MLSMNSRQRRAKGETDLEDQYRNAILPTISYPIVLHGVSKYYSFHGLKPITFLSLKIKRS